MSQSNRREFLSTAAASVAGLWSFSNRLHASGTEEAARRASSASSLRVTEIETHEVLLPYHDFNARTLFRYHGLGIQLRTVYIAKTNHEGLEGYGEAWGRGWPKDEVAKYVGTNPFAWIGDTNCMTELTPAFERTAMSMIRLDPIRRMSC